MSDTLMLGIGSVSLGGAVALGAGPMCGGVDWLNQRTLRNLGQRMAEVAMDLSQLPLYLRLWRCAILATLIVFWFAFGTPPLAFALAFLTQQLGPVWFDWQIDIRRRKLTEQTAMAARKIAGQVRIGMTLDEALKSVALQAPDPLGAILRRATRQLDQGKALRDVLMDIRNAVRIDAMALFTSALLVASESGGRLGDVLEKISRTLDELHRVQRKRESDTASGRLMVRLMAVFPVAFLALSYGIDSESIANVFRDFVGQIVLSIAVVLIYVSVRWARWILSKTG